MTELPERFLAVGAGVGLGPGVDADVLGQVAGVGEGFGAVGALVWLGLRVRLGVDLHVRLVEEGHSTHPTPMCVRRRERWNEATYKEVRTMVLT